ncbi:MAG: hypothetical protein ACPG4K_01435 [Haloferula sp.]
MPYYFSIPLLCLLLCSCGLLRAPVRVAGGVAQGTAQLGRAAVTKPKEAHEKRKAKKEAERRNREAKEAAARGAGGNLGGSSASFGSNPTFGSGGIPLPDPMESDPTVGPDPQLPVADE